MNINQNLLNATGDKWIDAIEGNEQEIIKRCTLFPELVDSFESIIKWMEFWLDEDLCDCEGPHTCGRGDRKNELQSFKDLLVKVKL